MARDEGLEALLREALADVPEVIETKMFGGLAWLVRGNLVCAAREDGMLARLGKGNDGWALALDDVAPMLSRGRRMQGWVRAGRRAFGDDGVRGRLIAAALDFVRTLPAKHDA